VEASTTSIGSCYGFGIRSPLPFHYLREGDGPALGVSTGSAVEGDAGEVVYEWPPTPKFPMRGRLHRNGSGFLLWIDTWGWFVVDPDAPHVTVPEAANIVRREERLWSIPAMLCFLARGDTAVHAAAVEVDGKAIVLAAPGTFGKTTLAAAFHAAGHRLLSEDNTCLRITDAPQVIPGPAMLRLRPDVAAQLEIPGVSRVAETDDRVHLAVDPERRGDAAPVPLQAILLLGGSDDDIRLERADSGEAVRQLFALAFRLPTDADRRRCFQAIVDLVRAVPVWHLRRPFTYSALPATVAHAAAHA
jgi:hypothetical protein